MKNNFFFLYNYKKMETTTDVPTLGIPLADGLNALFTAATKRHIRTKEGYNQAPKQNVAGQAFSFAIGIFAAYLSWTCNTIDGVDTPLKVVYAFFAFSFGILYLIYYAATRGFKICAKV